MPKMWAVVERTQGGDFYGKPKGYFTLANQNMVTLSVEETIEQALIFAKDQRLKIDRLVEKQIRVISAQYSKLKLEKKSVK